MAPLKYDCATLEAFYTWEPNILASIQSPCLHRVVGVFERNLRRGKLLCLLPELLAASTTCTAFAIHGRPQEEIDAIRPVIGFASVEGALRAASPVGEEVRDSLQHLLESVFLNHWTAFEVLATDLWIDAVDARPTSLGQVAFRKAASNADNPLMVFPPDGKAGTYLYHLKVKPFGWNMLDHMARGYKVCFGTPLSKLLLEPELMALQAIRQILIHRAGIADGRFVGKMKGHSKWSALEAGDSFPMDAEIVSAYFFETLRCAIALIQAVDQWLIENP